MAIQPQSGQPIAKPEPHKVVKARKDRKDAKQLKTFRDAVWKRERLAYYARTGEAGATCQYCGIFVFVEMAPRGEVHHRICRRAKATRYDPDNGVLLCAGYESNRCHERVTAHEIEV